VCRHLIFFASSARTVLLFLTDYLSLKAAMAPKRASVLVCISQLSSAVSFNQAVCDPYSRVVDVWEANYPHLNLDCGLGLKASQEQIARLISRWSHIPESCG